MTTYSLPQLLTLAEQAGFSGYNADVAAAIAEAESGGNPSAYNPETAAGTPAGWGSYGLWQIYRKAHPQYSPSALDTPTYNAQAAFQVYQAAGNSFTPWSTYKSGAYKQYLAQLTGKSGAPLPSGSGSSTGGSSGTATGTTLASNPLDPAGWVSAIQTGFTTTAQRLGLVTFGALVVLVGLLILFFSEAESQAQQAAPVAAKAAEVAA